MPSDPTRPLHERTPEEIGEYIDDHLIMALSGADYLFTNRDESEDYVRNRLVAISDSWETMKELSAEEATRRLGRLRNAIFGGAS